MSVSGPRMRLLGTGGGGEPPSVDARLEEHDRRLGLMEAAVSGIGAAVGRLDKEREAERDRRLKSNVESADADAAIIRIERKLDEDRARNNDRHAKTRSRLERLEDRLDVVHDKAEESGRYLQVTLTEEVKRVRTLKDKLVMAAIGLLCSSALVVLGALIKSCISR